MTRPPGPWASPTPAGVEMDRIAEEGDPNAYKLPHPHVEGAPLDFSFSGLKTAVLNLLNNARQKGEEISVPDLCASYRKAVVSCLTENFFKAAEMTGAKTLAAAGGCFRQPAAAPGAGAPGPGAGAESLPAGQAPVRGQRRHDCLPGVLRVPGGEHRRHGLKRLCPALH